MDDHELIYDWNSVEKVAKLSPKRRIQFLDETLRDGIQSPSVVDPSIDDKLRLVDLANDLGIDTMDIGLPGAGKRAVEDVTTIAEHIRDAQAAGQGVVRRAHARQRRPGDRRHLAEGRHRDRGAVRSSAARRSASTPRTGTSPRMMKLSADAIDLGRKYNLPVAYVTEDTTRSRPDVLTKLFTNAVEHGASRLIVCDTVGHARPTASSNLLKFTRNVLDGMGRPDVGIDWHGHNDRGLGVVNSIFAIEYGADRIHGTALGIGERVGNAALDQILLNLKLLGELPDHDLTKLVLWCKTASQATRVPIHPQYPLVGTDAFRTATGVHAAAIIKAEKKGDAWLADRIYSGVPGRHVRQGAGDRDRPLLRRIERRLLAEEARLRADAGAGRRGARAPPSAATAC